MRLPPQEKTIPFITASFFLRAIVGVDLGRLAPVVARLAAAFAPVLFSTVLFALPADEARADDGHPGGDYPLHCAAGIDGDLAAVIHLLGSAHGIDVNALDSSASSYPCGGGEHYTHLRAPLHWAARYGRATIAATLLSAGAHVNVKNGSDYTPLHLAARGDNAAVVSVLLSAGADVNAKEKYGQLAPLHFAVSVGHVSIISMLLSAGADVNAKFNGGIGGQTPLSYAVYVYAYAHFSAASVVPVVSLLLAAEADVNAKDNDGNTPLHWAAQGEHVSIVSLLLAAGAEVNAKTKQGETPLEHAIEYGGHISVVSLLLSSGAEVDPTDNYGNTPLIEAAESGNAAIVAMLVAAGANVNAQSDNGNAPLHEAVDSGNATIVAALLAAGAEVNAKNNNGTTPLLRTDGYSHETNAAIRALLIAAGGHWGAACENLLVVNPAGPTPPCLCESPNVGTADHCVAPSAENCAALNPPLFYDSAAAECFPYKPCGGGTLNRETNACLCAGAAALDDAEDNCECHAPNVGTATNCRAPSAQVCGGLTPPKFYDSAAEECVPLATCYYESIRNAGTNICECFAPNVGTGENCRTPSAQACGGLTPSQFYDSAARECVLFVECLAPAVLNANVNLCDCPSPNVGRDGVEAPGECAVPSAQVCGGLTPPMFYDATAGECVPLAICNFEEERNAATNECECLAPNVRADFGRCRAPSALHCSRTSPPSFYSPTLSACAAYDECFAAGDCDLSASVCRDGFAPERFYDAAAGECVPFAECHGTARLDRLANECECTLSSSQRHMRPDGSCESRCLRAETAVRQGAHYYSGRWRDYYQCECAAATATNVNGTCELLYPCHDSAIRKDDNSGCECPSGAFAHGDPSGGYHRPESSDHYGERPIIPATAECLPGHAPIAHSFSLTGWQASLFTDHPDPVVIAHFIAEHGRDPDGDYELHTAVERGYYPAAKLLIEHGAHVNLKNGDGDSPLHIAVREERAALITLLLRRGANVNATDGNGDTPLHLIARKVDTAENVALVSFLLDYGADPNLYNGDRQWRPLDLAYGRGDAYPIRWNMMAALIAGGATWRNGCVGGKVPNRFASPLCVCPSELSVERNGECVCPAHSHSQVNGLCLPRGSAQIETELAAMREELERLRMELAELNARLSLALTAPGMAAEAVNAVARQAMRAAEGIAMRRANFMALGRAELAGAAAPAVALSDTATTCRMLGGKVYVDSASGVRICNGVDQAGTFCLVAAGDVFPCRGLFRHVRRCNDEFHRPAVNPFLCGPRCGDDEDAVGGECE